MSRITSDSNKPPSLDELLCESIRTREISFWCWTRGSLSFHVSDQGPKNRLINSKQPAADNACGRSLSPTVRTTKQFRICTSALR